MKTIWKFQVTGKPIPMPKGAQIISAGIQFQGPQIWAIVDDTAENEHRNIAVVGTGHEMPDEYTIHIETVTDGPYVWHIFEVINPEK